MDTLYENAETGCCPRFVPEPWDEKEITWQGKLFLKDRVRCLLHVPLNFGKVVVRNVEKIKAADALPEQPLMLADHVSPWRIELYIAVGKEVPGCQMATISGTYLTTIARPAITNGSSPGARSSSPPLRAVAPVEALIACRYPPSAALHRPQDLDVRVGAQRERPPVGPRHDLAVDGDGDAALAGLQAESREHVGHGRRVGRALRSVDSLTAI